jgi:integrase
MKMGKEHVVPLSDAALALLSGLPRQGASIFPMGPDAMHNVAKRLHDGVTVHGFRSCFRDWAGDETNFERVDVELCLAHQAGDSTEQSYRRMTAVDKRRVIMQSWADYCGGNTFPTSGNVRTLHAVAG